MMSISATQVLTSARALIPGLLVTALVAMGAAFLGDLYKGSRLLFALLLGLALHFMSEDKRCKPGIAFASSTLLRMGVALLGLRLTIDHLVALGWEVATVLFIAVALTVALGAGLARFFKLPESLGLLIGGATAICGASAALAISSVLPKTANLERDTALTIVGVTTLSTVAMVLYPLLTQWLGFSAEQAGMFLGGTIHDVAQVVGAGFSLSTEAGNTATITKLLRVAFLVPVLLAISFMVRHRMTQTDIEKSTTNIPLLPWFMLLFLVFMLLNSTGLISARLQTAASQLSQSFLLIAIAGVGLKTSLQSITQLGWRPVAMLVLVTIGLAVMMGGYLLVVRSHFY
jgi:uncharacterized integral membrane protein (TIGR00698 family)